MKIDNPSLEVREMAKRWVLIEDLLEGTERLRAKRREYMPQEPLEESSQYDVRLKRAYLFPAYEDTIEKLSAKPFVKPVVRIDGDLPEELEAIETDADLEGSSLTTFAQELFETGLNYGLVHVLVDHTVTESGLTRAEEISSGARPYFVNIIPSNLLRWEWERRAGKKVLTRICIQEKRNVFIGDEEEEVVDVRVWTEEDVAVYRRDKDTGEYGLLEEPLPNTLGTIPLVTTYFNKTGFMQAKPPLFKLAETNLEHYQVYGDSKNTLRFASLGILFGAGFSDKQIANGVKISTNGFLGVANTDAKLKYVEYEGKAIDALFNQLEKIEQRMEQLGYQPLVSTPGKVTATRDKMSDFKTQAPVQRWIRNLEAMLFNCFSIAARWRELEIDENLKYEIFSDFVVSAKTAEDLQHLREMRKSSDISLNTYLRETKRRQVLSEDLDVEEEQEQILNEMSSILDVSE